MSTPKAYRYARFSHSRQAEGMSLERQADAAETWAKARGIALDDSQAAYVDPGVSASRGKNIVMGALGRFLKALDAGDIPPGSFLLVESLSRFSRLSPDDWKPILRRIVESGITVVFFDHNLEVSEATWDNPMVSMLLHNVGIMNREYVENLRRYKLAAWGKARGEMENGKAATSMLPFWLECAKTETGERGPITVSPSYGPIVERIFAEYLAGRGKGQIAAGLESELRYNDAGEVTAGTPAPNGAAVWRHTLIGRVLANRSVIGEFQPHKEVKTRITLKSGIAGALKRRREPVGEPIAGYYPAVVSAETFAQAAAMREQKQAKQGVRAGAREPTVTHLLANLARCPVCDAAMRRENKSGRNALTYVCSHALSGKAGACQRVRVVVADVERALIGAADTLGSDAPGTDPKLTQLIAATEARHKEAEVKARVLGDRMIAMMENGEEISSVVNAQHTKYENERNTLGLELGALRNKATAVRPNELKQRIAAMVNGLKGHSPGDPFGFDTPSVNAQLYACFSKVVIDYRSGELVLHWRHDGPSVVTYGQKKAGEVK